MFHTIEVAQLLRKFVILKTNENKIAFKVEFEFLCLIEGFVIFWIKLHFQFFNIQPLGNKFH